MSVNASCSVLPPALLALATVDDGASFADQFLERSRLIEFFKPISGRNVNQNPMDKQNWERRRSSKAVEDGFKYINVYPLADINNDGRWAQIEGVHEGAEFTCDCRRLLVHARENETSISHFFGNDAK